MFKKVGLIAKRGDPRVEETLKSLVHYLKARHIAFVVDPECARQYPREARDTEKATPLGANCDLVVAVGGDGTLLSAARALVEHNVRLLGINFGRIGFLADISPPEIQQCLDEVFAGRFQEEERFLLHALVLRQGKEILRTDAFNDVVVHKWKIARLIAYDTYIDGSFLTTQRSDGLIVATPTGSTAYALSGGGPILHPTLQAIVLVPICPHTLSNRPIVVDAASRVEVVVRESQQVSAQLTCDGQTTVDLQVGDRIIIRRKDRAIHLIHPEGYDYFATLRSKLHWGLE
jgi:NAD+ kinase